MKLKPFIALLGLSVASFAAEQNLDIVENTAATAAYSLQEVAYPSKKLLTPPKDYSLGEKLLYDKELAVIAFSFLSAKEWAACQAVSKDWQKVTNNESIYMQHNFLKEMMKMDKWQRYHFTVKISELPHNHPIKKNLLLSKNFTTSSRPSIFS